MSYASIAHLEVQPGDDCPMAIEPRGAVVPKHGMTAFQASIAGRLAGLHKSRRTIEYVTLFRVYSVFRVFQVVPSVFFCSFDSVQPGDDCPMGIEPRGAVVPKHRRPPRGAAQVPMQEGQ